VPVALAVCIVCFFCLLVAHLAGQLLLFPRGKAAKKLPLEAAFRIFSSSSAFFANLCTVVLILHNQGWLVCMFAEMNRTTF